jgi:F-type H+-transporting ATPase subunit a
MAAEHHSILYEPVNKAWHATGLDEALGVEAVPDHVVMGCLIVVLVAAVFIPLGRRLSLDRPSKLQQMTELFVEAFSRLMEDVIGHGAAKRFMPFVGALGVFIWLSNMSGLLFFLQPPTGNTNTTFALAITAWSFYHLQGLKKHGFKYFKQFLGPVGFLIPLFIPLELISHTARVLSLGLRLFGNIFGEHTATNVFFMIPFIAPFPMMALGIFGGTLQTFVFCMLTIVYIAGAEAAEH